MASDTKDRLGNKFRDVEAAREDQWARQHDNELVEQLRKRLNSVACPQCKQFLVPKSEDGIHMLACPAGDGAWLDATQLEGLLKARK